MEEVFSFFWLVWFTGLELGGSNDGTGFRINDPYSLSIYDLESEPASNSEAFTSATSDFFEWQSTVLCQGLLWKSHHFPVSFFVFPMSFFACGLDWLS